MALNEVDVAIRRKIKTGFTDKDRPCAMELAQLATSGEYSGFEDPKVAAQEALETAHRQPWQAGKRPDFLECERDGCSNIIRLHARYDGFAADAGACALQTLCLKDSWEESEIDPDVYRDVVMKEGISFAGGHSGGDYCPHVGCTFNCGFSVDGNSGTGGECMNEKREVPEDLPVTAVVE